METLRGTAKKVGIGSEVGGTVSNGRGSVSTTYVAVFELDGIVVHARATRPPTVADGDEVVIAVTLDDGVFVAPALRNVTRGTVDHQAWMGPLVIGILFVFVGIGVAIAALQESDTWVFALLGLAFTAAGAWHAWSSNRTRIAEATVRSGP